MLNQISIDIVAAPRQVFELAGDVSRWPELLPHYRRVTIHSRKGDRVLATMVAVRSVGPFGIPVAWRSVQWADPSDPSDLRLHFVHVRGATRGMNVTWHIRPTALGCRVTIEHAFLRRLPLLGTDVFPTIVDRLFVRPIAGRTLASFKLLAEAG